MSGESTRDIAALLRERVIPRGGNRYGLVIGIEEYKDSRLNLRCAAADAKAIFDLMIDSDCGMFPKDNVRLLLNEYATRESIWRALSALRRDAGENDTVWIYYAGHAAPEDSLIYWVTHDADVDDLYGTGLSNHQLSRVMNDMRARRLLVLLDCCHAAAMAAQKNKSRALLSADETFAGYKGHGRITLSASDGKEKSVELGDIGHGAFTYFLEKGLRGEADADGDGVVTADELWHFLRSKVVDSSRKAGNTQTPVLLGEMQHDFALSLNPLEFGRRQKIGDTIRRMVGMGKSQLTTTEGHVCLELLRRAPRNEAERDLMAEFSALLEGSIRLNTFRRLIEDVRDMEPGAALGSTTKQDSVSPPVEADTTSTEATDKNGGNCEIQCGKMFPQLPEKYQWDREQCIEFINNWSSKHLGVLSNMADHCEVQDVQAHGYFAWVVKCEIEKREWTECRKGLNVKDPSGSLKFLSTKPPRIPTITPEIADRIADICPDCHGTGTYVCPNCYGKGYVQCPECKGTGAFVDLDGDYDYSILCQKCNGTKMIPCTACKGIAKRQCRTCNGTGVPFRLDIHLTEFPKIRTEDELRKLPRLLSSDNWVESDECLTGSTPIAIEICSHCKGTGEFVCDVCFGKGCVQCPECKGTGAFVDLDGDYDYSIPCQRCNGAKMLPCTACKGVPNRPCEICNGSGVVAVYPAIEVSRIIETLQGTSAPGVGMVGDKRTVALARLEGDVPSVCRETATLLESFEGSEVLPKRLALRAKDDNARMTRIRVDLRWYPYMLCRMKKYLSGESFVIAINCINKKVIHVQGACPKSSGFWSRLFGWGSKPFEKHIKPEQEFMLKQLES